MRDQTTQLQQRPMPSSRELTALLVRVSGVKDNGIKDKQAFAVLFEYFAPRVKSYIFKLGSDEIMAEELAQKTLLQVWRKAHLFNAEKAAASTWIFRVARNLRLDLIRKEKHFIYDDYNLHEIEDEKENAETVVNRDQHAVIVRKAMEKLPLAQRKIVALSFYEGLSHSEIAKRLNIPLGTVKSRMRLAFKRIKDRIGEVL